MDLEEAQEIGGIKGASDNEKAGSPTHAFSSVVENVLSTLTEYEIRLIEMRHFKSLKSVE